MEGGALKSGCEQTVPQCALDIALQLIDWSSRRETRTLDGLVIHNRHREAKRSASFSDAVQFARLSDRKSKITRYLGDSVAGSGSSAASLGMDATAIVRRTVVRQLVRQSLGINVIRPA